MLADGAQAAFAAGAVAALDAAGVRWTRAAGAGLGAEIAVLAALGEAGSAAGRWRQQGVSGCPLFTSQAATARALLGARTELLAVPDAWRLSGWLDTAALAAHIGDGAAGWAEALAKRGVSCRIAVCDTARGADFWVELAAVEPDAAVQMLRAAASFPGGWGPIETTLGGKTAMLTGGVLAAAGLAEVLENERWAWDIVCGFPVPAARRPGLGASLLEQIQRRAETSAAAWVAAAAAGRPKAAIRVIAPGEACYRQWATRDGADLGVEYPLPWERNGDLVAALVEFGAFSAAAAGA